MVERVGVGMGEWSIGISLEKRGYPQESPWRWGRRGHRDLLREEGVPLGMPISMPIRICFRKEAVPLGMPISVPIGICLESLLGDGVGAHKNLLRERGHGRGIGISLERKGCPLDLLDPLDP